MPMATIVRYFRSCDQSSWHWLDTASVDTAHGPFDSKRAAKRDRALYRIRTCDTPLRVACPYCNSPSIRESQGTLESQEILGWELGLDNRPQPAEWGGTETHYETAERRGFDCASCGREFADPLIVGVDSANDVRARNRSARNVRRRLVNQQDLAAILRRLITSVESNIATGNAALQLVLADARRLLRASPPSRRHLTRG